MCCGQESQRCPDGKDKAVFDRRGCNDRGVLVQGWESLWSWFGRGVGTKRGCRRGKRKKIWSFGVQEAGVCQATEASVVLPEVLGYLLMKS